jgi:hypothetical protein
MAVTRCYRRPLFVDAILWDGSEEAQQAATSWGIDTSGLDSTQTWWLVYADNGDGTTSALPYLDEVFRAQYVAPDEEPPW